MKSEKVRIADRIETLERRADHLAKRIAESDIDLSYDKAELGALQWAVRILRTQFKIEEKGKVK